MEMWNKILMIIVAIVCLIVILGVGSKLFREGIRETEDIEGHKSFVVGRILDLVYDCFNANDGKRGSVICEELTINSTETISSSDILDSIDTSKIERSNLEVDDLGKSAEIIIRYENQIIYVQRVENERIGT